MTYRLIAIASLVLVASLLSFAKAAEPPPQTVEFSRDIRPILSDVCFQCHGPDKAKRKADLRLDTMDGLFTELDGGRVVVTGKPGESELFRRITAKEKDERMPPDSARRPLTEREIELFREWIAQGAKWQKHWAFTAPVRPALPAVKNKSWPRNEIDHFVLARLEREGLSPSREADRTTLLRRVTLDLTGLPPTLKEVDDFLADKSANAYEKVVDRLLASPRYGERMAQPWLDAARYADTNGYQTDGERVMWRWRDWVIQAFNQNMPFDRFTIEQIAGDLLFNGEPKATAGTAGNAVAVGSPLNESALNRLIATGFNRNHRINAEGGIIPEEFAVEYVVDRVDTTATVWLGLTMGCARCHDHKYDPITQKEFYQVYAYFNNVPEPGRGVRDGNSPPFIKAPTPEQAQQLQELERKLSGAEDAFARLGPVISSAQAAWEKSAAKGPLDWTIAHGLIKHFPLDGRTSTAGKFHGGSAFIPGRLGQAAGFDGKSYLDAGDVANLDMRDKFSLAVWIRPEGESAGNILSRMNDSQTGIDGYNLCLKNGKLQFNLVKRWLDDAIRTETEERIPSGEWHHVLATYDGGGKAEGVRVYIDGQPQKLTIHLDELSQSFKAAAPFRIGAGPGPEDRFRGAIDDVRVYQRILSPEEALVVAAADSVSQIAAKPPSERGKHEAQKTREYFLREAAPESIRRAYRDVLALRDQKQEFAERIPTTMIMQDAPKPRDTFVLVRGQYDRPGEKVTPGVPSVLSPLPKDTPANRLGFAKWLVDPSNPLTARVAVNRYWQMYFGAGIVKTTEDFGFQGDPPSHPELLDWLATEFIRTGWDVKAMQKRIVTSATYRQSSAVGRPGRAALESDPDNRLLSRGPRSRLSAVMIRDQALAASGLLVEQVGGPSVKPYQPEGLWKDLGVPVDYPQDKGSKLYRRSLYTFWKRTAPPPALMTFDAAGRESCMVRETRTNTPLQALNLLNDITYVEAARVLAQRMMTEGREDPANRITLAFRLATGRPPRPGELSILLDGFRKHQAEYRNNRPAAMKVVSAGEHPRNEKLDVAELAAYTAVAQVILNLHETVTKE